MGEDVQRQFLSNLAAHFQKKGADVSAGKPVPIHPFVRILKHVLLRGGGALEFLSQLTQDYSQEPLTWQWSDKVMRIFQATGESVTLFTSRFVDEVDQIPRGYLDAQGAMVEQFCWGMVRNLHPKYQLARAKVLQSLTELQTEGTPFGLSDVQELIAMAVEVLHLDDGHEDVAQDPKGSSELKLSSGSIPTRADGGDGKKRVGFDSASTSASPARGTSMPRNSYPSGGGFPRSAASKSVEGNTRPPALRAASIEAEALKAFKNHTSPVEGNTPILGESGPEESTSLHLGGETDNEQYETGCEAEADDSVGPGAHLN
jgi:hypothetical protein